MIYFLVIAVAFLKATVKADDDNTGLTSSESRNESTQDSAAIASGSIWKTIDHPYYTEKPLAREDVEGFLKYWVDIDLLLSNNSKSNRTHGARRHPDLTNKYRMVITVELRNFKFPYYGLDTDNVTITTGGFLFMAEYLGATQYLAPFMANFRTTDEPNSDIPYVETENFFAVEWRDVTLNDDKSAGNFTFQARLEKNGDIYFIYEKIPIKYGDVSDESHRRNAGLYEFYDEILRTLPYSKFVAEYIRVDIQSSFISNYTVIKLEARESCISIKDRVRCLAANLPNFNCTWCGPSCFDPRSFCSDSHGNNRRQSDFKKYKCDSVEVCAAAKVVNTTSSEIEAAKGTNSSSPKIGAKEEDDEHQGWGLSGILKEFWQKLRSWLNL